MVRRFHRSIYDELDELRASMDYLYQLALEPEDIPLSSIDDDTGIICRNAHRPAAEVVIHDDCVTVTADLAPGTGTVTLSVDLMNDTTLRITTGYSRGAQDGTGSSAGPERASFSVHRIVQLPVPVIKDGARASLRNSVLDLCLKKAGPQ